MDLVGAWLRQLLRAGTAAAIVPVALLAALLVIALGSGGLGGLGSLGEVLGSTVNGVVVGVETLIDQLSRALGLKPRAR